MAQFETKITEEGGGLRVTLAGECDLAVSAQLSDALLAAVRRAPLVIVDLAGLGFLDSSGVHSLITAHHAARQLGGRLVVVNPVGAVATVLDLTGVGALLSPPPKGMGESPTTHQTPPAPSPPGQVSPGQIPFGQVSPGQIPFGQVSSGQVSSGQVSPGQVSSGQVSPGQVSSGQVSLGQVSSGQVSLGQIPSGQVSLGQIPSGQVSLGQVSSGHVPPGHVLLDQAQPGRGETASADGDRGEIAGEP